MFIVYHIESEIEVNSFFNHFMIMEDEDIKEFNDKFTISIHILRRFKTLKEALEYKEMCVISDDVKRGFKSLNDVGSVIDKVLEEFPELLI